MFLRFLIKAGSVFLLPLSDQKCNRDWKGRFFFFFFPLGFEGKAQKVVSSNVSHFTSLPPYNFTTTFVLFSNLFLSLLRSLYETQLLSHIIHPSEYIHSKFLLVRDSENRNWDFLINVVNLKISFRSNFFVI